MGDARNSDYLKAPTSVTSTPTTTGSTTAIDLLADGGPPGYFNFAIKGADVHMYMSNVSTMADATTSNAMYHPAGAFNVPYYIDENTRYFKAIATSTVSGQAITWCRS